MKAKMGEVTVRALGQAFGRIDAPLQQRLMEKETSITMHMFTRPELDSFSQAWGKVTLPRKDLHFHDGAEGHPHEWNRKERTTTVNKKMKETWDARAWGAQQPNKEEYHLIEDFLRVRVSSRGKRIVEELEFVSAEGRLGEPGGIERYEFVGKAVPEGLRTGVHGTIPEALYGILEHQKLRHGTRTLQRKGEEVVGVYVHERNAHKAKNYAIWTQCSEMATTGV